MMTNKTPNQGGNRSDTAPPNPPACVCSVCVYVTVCVCVLSVRALRPTLASALHQRPSIIEQKLCDAQGNEIVYFYHSTLPTHTASVHGDRHRGRHIPFFPRSHVGKWWEAERTSAGRAQPGWNWVGWEGGGRWEGGGAWGHRHCKIGGAFRGTSRRWWPTKRLFPLVLLLLQRRKQEVARCAAG